MSTINNVILNCGVQMPLLGLGTFLLRPPEVFSTVEKALNFGYKLIDTASVYKNESSIGQVLKTASSNGLSRESIFITSKLGPSHQGTEKSRTSALSSLEALQTNYLDLYLIHWPGSAGMKPENSLNVELRKQSWKQLEKLCTEGKCKAIGVSNYTLLHLKELLEYCDIVPAVLQIEVHPYLTQEPIREFCKENGIHVQAYSSLGSQAGCKELLSDPTVISVAQNYGKTPAQILLRWAIEHGMSVIPKTTNLDRLKENMDIFDFFLSTEHISELDQLNQNQHFCWNPQHVK